MGKILQRPDVVAVLNILKERGKEVGEQKINIKMTDEEGKTWLGATFWNVGTLIQDFPNIFLAAGFCIMFGVVVTIVQVI